jgi:hypothetical protein
VQLIRDLNRGQDYQNKLNTEGSVIKMNENVKVLLKVNLNCCFSVCLYESTSSTNLAIIFHFVKENEVGEESFNSSVTTNLSRDL